MRFKPLQIVYPGKNINLFLLFSILTVSFDVFLVINLGINIRISQFLLLPFMLQILTAAIIKKKIRMPLAFGLLACWSIFALIFSFQGDFLFRNIGYGF